MAENTDTGATQTPPNTDTTNNAELVSRRRASAKKAAASAAASDQQTDPAAADQTEPTGDNSFGHSVTGTQPPSPQPADAPAGGAAPADVNTMADLTGEQPASKPAVQQASFGRQPYDIQKVYATANTSVKQDDSGRWIIEFPKDVDTSKMDQTDYRITPGTTFATRDLAYRAAAELLKTSPSMAYAAS